MLALFFALVFILLNGFFVAAEFSLVKLRATYQRRPGVDDPVGQAVEKIDRYLSVTQLGITLASLGLGWLGEPAIGRQLRRLFVATMGREPGHTAETVVVVVAFTLLTFGHVLLGELLPKLVAIQRSHTVARLSVWPLRLVFYGAYPVLWLLEASSRALLALLGLRLDHHAEAKLSEGEVLGILAAHVAHGEGASDKQDLVRRLLRFSTRTTKLAMVSRVDIAFLPVTASGRQAYEALRQTEFSRLPLSKGEDLDEVVGYLYVKDFYRDPKHLELTKLESLSRPVMFVAETQSLVAVLREMQRAQAPFALVVDEFGGVSGLVTIEDILEEIVGEIRDELDVEGQRMVRGKDGAWDVDAAVLLDELRAEAEADHLDLGAHAEAQSFASAVVEALGRVPRVGDTVTVGRSRIRVTTMARRRICRVRVEKSEPEPPTTRASTRPTSA